LTARTPDGVPPLILTALLDDAAQQRFDRLRRSHFPAARNYLDAHLTLFHRLPGGQQGALVAAVQAAADRPAIQARVTKIRRWSNGVAYVLTAPELTGLRSRLARDWEPWLSPQDRPKADLHITVQNKVDSQTAARLHAELALGFEPHDVPVVGLGLWRYLGGPWEAVRRFPFRTGSA
jgi:2'-5' RNA ligase superfamily